MNEPTTKKSLNEILDKVSSQAGKQLKSWREDGYVHMTVNPPDLIIVTDQMKRINELAPHMALPMSILKRIAATMHASNDTDKVVIGQVLDQCHTELQSLTSFCRDLSTKEVVYPLKVPEPEPEPESEPKE